MNLDYLRISYISHEMNQFHFGSLQVHILEYCCVLHEKLEIKAKVHEYITFSVLSLHECVSSN